MVSIFVYNDYRDFLKARLKEMPKKGYGQAHKMSLHLNVHTTLVSQVLSGTKTFTLEQTSLVCDFLGLTELESEYLLLLVQLDRAGNQPLQVILKRQLVALKKKADELVNRLKSQKKLTEEQRAIFYSHWSYAAIRQMTAIKGYNNLDRISEHFNLPKKQTKIVLDFLIGTGLCKEEQGKIHIGPSSTHLESTSPWVRVHHANWRQKALEEMSRADDSTLHYTAPLTISKNDALKLREMIVTFLEQTDQLIDPSPSEELHCLNIDWFKLGG